MREFNLSQKSKQVIVILKESKERTFKHNYKMIYEGSWKA